MKHTLKFSIAPILFALVCSLSLSAATTPGHHTPTVDKGKKAVTTNRTSNKQTAVKENKKFTTQNFYYDGFGSITSGSSWSTPVQSCPTGTANLCYITFDDATYPLVSGKPNSTTVLDIVNRLWISTADGAEIIDGTTHTGIFVHKKA